MHGRMRTWIMAAAVALVTTTGAVLIVSGPAEAEGDPALDSAIAITPPAGWVLAPSSVSDAQAAQEEQIVGEAEHFEFKVASKEWTQPNSTNELSVTLWAYSPQEISQMRTQVDSERETCGQGQTVVTRSVSGVPGSKETLCSGPPSSGNTYAFAEVGWFDADTYATVHAIGLPPAQVVSYAREVARAIPTGGFSAVSGNSSSDLLLIGVGAVVLVAAVAAVVVVRRRRPGLAASPFHQPFATTADTPNHGGGARQPVLGVMRQPTEATPTLPAFGPGQSAAPAAAPGWHSLPGDPTKTAYWDGTQWAAFRQWDGQQWVDAAAVRR